MSGKRCAASQDAASRPYEIPNIVTVRQPALPPRSPDSRRCTTRNSRVTHDGFFPCCLAGVSACLAIHHVLNTTVASVRPLSHLLAPISFGYP
ncbi:MAG TPA: hypothetical protein VH164_13155 [Ktedonobacteraceae bacterium]|nr:hypothetical protein [Ktedonobacteraceae bacterium]